MNRLKFVEDVVAHLQRQGKKSLDPVKRQESGAPVCLYRAPDGCKCAIGGIMPDDMYDPEFEGRAPSGFLFANAKMASKAELFLDFLVAEYQFSISPLSGDMPFLREVQYTLHDSPEVEFPPTLEYARKVLRGLHE